MSRDPRTHHSYGDEGSSSSRNGKNSDPRQTEDPRRNAGEPRFRGFLYDQPPPSHTTRNRSPHPPPSHTTRNRSPPSPQPHTTRNRSQPSHTTRNRSPHTTRNRSPHTTRNRSPHTTRNRSPSPTRSSSDTRRYAKGRESSPRIRHGSPPPSHHNKHSNARSRRDRSDSPPPQKRRAGSRDRSGPGALSRGAAPPPMSFANIRTPSPPVMTLSPPPAPSMNRSNSKEYSQRASRTSPRRSSRKSPASPRRQRYRSPSYDAIKPSRRHRSPSDEPHRSRPSPSRFRNPSGNNLPENPQIQRNSSKEPMPRRASPRSGQSRNTPERFDERSETRRVHRIPSGDGDRQRDEPGAYRDQTRMDRSSLERRERHNPSASKPGVPAGRTYDPEDSLADDQSYRLGTQAGLGMSRPTSQSGVGMSGPGSHAGLGMSGPGSHVGLGMSGPGSHVGLGMSGPGSHAGLGMSGIAREGANYPNIHDGMTDRNMQYSNPDFVPSYPPIPVQGVDWQTFLEREKQKEELLSQYQAGLLVQKTTINQPVAESSSSKSDNTIAESILKLIMERGTENKSNIDFLRTPEMRGVLRRIFSKELADSKSDSDKGFLNSLKEEIDPDVEEVILSSDDEKDSKAKLRKKIQEIESRDKAADNEDNRSRVTDSKRSRSRDKSTKKQKRYSPEYSPDKSHKSKRSKRSEHRSPDRHQRSRSASLDLSVHMKPWRRDGSRPSSSLLKHKDDHSDRHHNQEKRNYHENDDRHHKSSRGERDKDHYQHVDKYSERQRCDPRDERDSNRNRPITRDNSPTIVSEKEQNQPYRNQRDSAPADMELLSKVFATAVGYIDDIHAILQITSKGACKDGLVILNKANLWVSRRNLNENTITCTKKTGNDPIDKLLPMGTGVALNARKLSGDVFPYQAIVVWPAIAVEPECGYKFSELEQQLEYFRSTFSLFKYEPLTFDGIKPTSNETWTAKVDEIIDENWGIIELQAKHRKNSITGRFNCFFNKDCVWSHTGNLLKMPLQEVLKVGQSVNIVCRSVIKTKGLDLAKVKSLLTLQALVVSLDKNNIPDGAPRGLELEASPGTFCSGRGITSYLFNKELIKKLNIQLQIFTWKTQKSIIGLDKDLFKSIDPPDERKTKEIEDPKSKLKGVMGRVKSFCFGEAGYIEGVEEPWLCVFHPKECLLSPNQKFKELYREGFLVIVYGQKVSGRRKAQYIAQQVVNVVQNKSKVVEFNFYPPTADQLHYYAQVNNVLEGRPPSELQEYYDNVMGEVTYVISKTFGVISFGQDKKALFKLSDVWLSPSKRATDPSVFVSSILPVGTQVTMHCVMLNSTGQVQYFATSIWKTLPCPFPVGGTPVPERMSSLSSDKITQFRDQVNKIEVDLSSTSTAKGVLDKTVYQGRVMISCSKMGSHTPTGGILEFYVSDRSLTEYAAFCLDAFPAQMAATLSQVGCTLSFTAVPRIDQTRQKGVLYIANKIKHSTIQTPRHLADNLLEPTQSMLNRLMTNLDSGQSIRQAPLKLAYGVEDVSKPPPPMLPGGDMLPDGPTPDLEEPPVLPPTARILDNGKGAVACILNENFGIIHFKTSINTEGYGLFDNYDLYVSKTSKASDYPVSINNFVDVNDEVMFHAVEVDSTLPVAWQITALWKGIPNFVAPSVPSDTITQNKVNVFRQVVESCEDQITQLEQDKHVSGTSAYQRKIQLSIYPIPLIFTPDPQIAPQQTEEPLFGRAPPTTNEPPPPHNYPHPPFMEGVPPPFSPFPPAGMLGQRPGMLVHSSWGLGRPPFSRMPQPFVRFAGGGPPPPGTRPPFQPRQQVRPQPPRPVVDERAPASVQEAVKAHLAKMEASRKAGQSINEYVNIFKDKPLDETEKEKDGVKKPSAGTLKEINTRFLELEALKKSMASYAKYQELRIKKPNSLPKIQEPNPSEQMSSGAWNDAIIKWKALINQAVKNIDSGADDSVNEADNDLPLTLGDASTVGEIVKVYDSTTVIVKLSKMDQHAFLDISRIWVKDHKLFEGITHIEKRHNNKVNIYAKRIFTPGQIKYQGIYAHVGLPATNLGTYKYPKDMAGFIRECQKPGILQSQLDAFIKKCKSKPPL